MTWSILTGDCIEQMRTLDDCSIDAVVCDPPYGIGFMGKEWDRVDIEVLTQAQASKRERPDGRTSVASPAGAAGTYDLSLTANRRYQGWCELWARECLRVLKPGGHLLASCGSRTYQRMACGIEDAGFEIRDSIMWLYGSGFPKSLDVSKAIDKAAGAEREVVGTAVGASSQRTESLGPFAPAYDRTVSATEDAACWDGWGTALKPAHEPIVVARKPLIGTVAANVLEHGTGGINVAACRIEGAPDPASWSAKRTGIDTSEGRLGQKAANIAAMNAGLIEPPDGRWPANVVLDEEAAEELDAQTGELTSGANPTRRNSDKFRTAYGDFEGQREIEPARGVDTGGASRFFYCAKTSRGERNAGLDDLPGSIERLTTTPTATIAKGRSGGKQVDDREYSPAPNGNDHPTVKPINLMRWLVRLVTPPGGTVLDPFTGSGSTGCAAVLEGFDFIGCEREAEYVAIAEARIAFWAQHVGRELDAVLGLVAASDRAQKLAEGVGQIGLELDLA